MSMYIRNQKSGWQMWEDYIVLCNTDFLHCFAESDEKEILEDIVNSWSTYLVGIKKLTVLNSAEKEACSLHFIPIFAYLFTLNNNFSVCKTFWAVKFLKTRFHCLYQL